MNKPYKSQLGLKHQIFRLAWSIVWIIFARWLPRTLGSGWKRFLLRSFGANIHPTALIYSTAKIYYPPYLTMEEYSCLGPDVDCYCVDHIFIGKCATVSQRAFLCTASHDINSPNHDLIVGPLFLSDHSWVGAEAFVGMNVTIGEGAVVGARAAVFKSVDAWTVVGGNPAKVISKRVMKES